MLSTNKSQTSHRSSGAASASPYQQRTSPRENPTQQLIRQAVDFLVEQLRQGKSETLTAYLSAMAQFHSCSFGNILQIARQKPDATRVAGIRTWNEFGRYVRKGEKGIQLLAPMVGFRRQRQEPSEEAQAGQERQRVLVGFRAVYVFDFPEMKSEVNGEVGEHRGRLIDFLNQQNIQLEFNEKIAPALGVFYGGKIVLLPGHSKAEEFVTLIHETAHELLHRTERRILTTQTVRETEAEAVAFVVGRAVGLEAGTTPADYIQLYHGNAELLAESLEVIQRTSAVILDAIQTEPAPENEAVAEVA
jgi:N-terminal domain of anti-restriction factor ArdC